MLRKITLKNFMSHAETVVELADGLTVLTGPNNCGKSAIVAALQTIASNGRTTHVRRHNEKCASVTVETSEGDIVEWERKGKTVKYVINGEDIHRVGQSVPDRLHDVLKLDRVDLDTGKAADRYDIHFGEQKSPVFLLGETGRRAAEFFASSSDVSRLMEMQALHRSQIKEQKKEQKRLQTESEKNVARLAALDPIAAISDSVEQAESIASNVADQVARGERIRKLVESIELKRKECERLKAVSVELACLENAATSPSLLQTEQERCAGLTTLIKNISDQERLRHQLSANEKSLQQLEPTPPQHALGHATGLIKSLNSTRRQIEALNREIKSLDAITPPPELESIDRLQNLTRRIETGKLAVTAIGATSQVLSKLESAPETQDTNPLSVVIGRWDTLSAKRQQAVDAAQAAEQQLQLCTETVQAFIKQNPKCATCGGDLDSATLLSSALDAHTHASPAAGGDGASS